MKTCEQQQCVTVKLQEYSGPLYFKTTHETKKKWSYIAGGLKINVNLTQKIALWYQIKRSYNQGWS